MTNFETWAQETMPLIMACAMMQRMHLENHMAVKQADVKPWSDDELNAQRELIENLRKGS